jgi:nicotinamidase-related amidase
MQIEAIDPQNTAMLVVDRQNDFMANPALPETLQSPAPYVHNEAVCAQPDGQGT